MKIKYCPFKVFSLYLNIITNALIRRMQETSGSVEGHVMAS